MNFNYCFSPEIASANLEANNLTELLFGKSFLFCLLLPVDDEAVLPPPPDEIAKSDIFFFPPFFLVCVGLIVLK